MNRLFNSTPNKLQILLYVQFCGKFCMNLMVSGSVLKYQD